MERFEKIAVLNTAVQAQLVAGVLSERGIPHVLRSYHDSAYDGVYQGFMGWGHIEAPQRFRQEILEVVDELTGRSESSGATDESDGPEDDAA